MARSCSMSRDCPLCLGISFIAISGLFVAAIVDLALTLRLFNPVFKPVHCVSESSAGVTEEAENSDFFNITLISQKACRNLNQYTLKLTEGAEGVVYVMDGSWDENFQALDLNSWEEAGSASIINLTLEANVETKTNSSMNFTYNASSMVSVITQENILVTAEFPVLGFSYVVEEKQMRYCFFKFEGKDRVSPEVCGWSLQSLQGGANGNYLELSPETIASKRHLRNYGFTVAFLACFLLALSFLVCGLNMCRRLACCKPSATTVGTGDPNEQC